MMLIYNEDKSVVEEYGMTTQIEKALKGRPKAYFNAHHVQEGKVIELVIGEEVEAQDW
jgi:outer membrane protein assembly factor BamD (BamD/ComL family)